jgi:transposase InsO family protein
MPVTTSEATAAVNFIKTIVFRFGVPHSIITDNGSNFTSVEFREYYEGLGIQLRFASVAHPQTNVQVEKELMSRWRRPMVWYAMVSRKD